MTPDPIQRAVDRYCELREIIEAADRVRVEFSTLDAFLRQAHHLFPDALEWPVPRNTAASGAESSEPTKNTTEKVSEPPQYEPQGRQKTSALAFQVLFAHGQKHMKELLQLMRAAGWDGNPDDTKAEKTLFNVMTSHKDRFRNVGKNTWEVINDLL